MTTPLSKPRPLTSPRAKQVTIVQRVLPHYRLPFFASLHRHLAEVDVSLSVVYGFPAAASAVPWAVRHPYRTLGVAGKQLIWQPMTPQMRAADLLIVEQASKLLLNYYLLGRQGFGMGKLAFWGHGANFRATREDLLSEWLKRQVSGRVHWWFAYTERSQETVEALGFPADRITNVQNAIDTSRLRSLAAEITEVDRARIREHYHLRGTRVGLFCGSMYAEKRLDFLLQAARLIKERLPDFELLLIGSGPDEDIARAAAAASPWIRFVGPKFDKEKVELFSISHAFLMPGLVGLAILDAFSLGTPLVTTEIPYHSPEIAYLRPGENGLMSEDTVRGYAEAVTTLLDNPETYARLRDRALRDGSAYTVDEMAQRFRSGILNALSLP